MIEITFRHSYSTSHEKLLFELAGRPSFEQIEIDGKVWFQWRFAKKRLKEVIPILRIFKRIKNKRIVIDGSERSYAETFGWVDCYEEKARRKHPKNYCFGHKNELGGENIFGCRSASAFLYAQYGRFCTKSNRWKFNKSELKEALATETKSCELCPAYKNHGGKVIDALPVAIDVVHDEGWRIEEPADYFESRPIQKIIVRDAGERHKIRLIGMEMNGREALLPIEKKSGRRLPTSDEFFTWRCATIEM